MVPYNLLPVAFGDGILRGNGLEVSRWLTLNAQHCVKAEALLGVRGAEELVAVAACLRVAIPLGAFAEKLRVRVVFPRPVRVSVNGC